MSKKTKKNTTAAPQPTDENTNNGTPEVKVGFFKRHWNNAVEKVTEHKGAILGAIGGAAAAAGAMYFLGREDVIEFTDLEEAEGCDTESPQDE